MAVLESVIHPLRVVSLNVVNHLACDILIAAVTCHVSSVSTFEMQYQRLVSWCHLKLHMSDTVTPVA